MTPPATIRPARTTDAARLAALSAVLGYPSDEHAMLGRLTRLLGHASDLVLVAESAAGEIVGWVHAAEQELLESGGRCEILGLVVDAGHRGQGAGRRLVEQVEQWAAARDLDCITVRSNVNRAESHPFYQRLGYVRTKTQHAYRKRLSAAAPGASRGDGPTS
jgi:ribosomal protein S18 acetylase RimI-like enzyme